MSWGSLVHGNGLSSKGGLLPSLKMRDGPSAKVVEAGESATVSSKLNEAKGGEDIEEAQISVGFQERDLSADAVYSLNSLSKLPECLVRQAKVGLSEVACKTDGLLQKDVGRQSSSEKLVVVELVNELLVGDRVLSSDDVHSRDIHSGEYLCQHVRPNERVNLEMNSLVS